MIEILSHGRPAAILLVDQRIDTNIAHPGKGLGEVQRRNGRSAYHPLVTQHDGRRIRAVDVARDLRRHLENARRNAQVRDLAPLRETQPGKGMIHIENRHGTDRAITQPQVIGRRVNNHALRPAHFLGGLLSLGQVSAADQQRDAGISSTQRFGRTVANGAGTAQEQNRVN
ncbi:hypothetical protein D3C81_1582320 [compost metagenome]